jgi:type II secretory pathway component PulJ
MKINTRQGISLVEVMVTVLLAVSILAGIYAAFIVGERTWRYYADSIMVRQQVRTALLVLTNELREASGAIVVKEEDPPGVRLNFLKPSAGQVSYLWNSGGNDANKLIRQDDLGARIIANNISSVDYVVTDDAIFVDINATSRPKTGGSVDLRLREQVAWRAKTSLFRSGKGQDEKAEQ